MGCPFLHWTSEKGVSRLRSQRRCPGSPCSPHLSLPHAPGDAALGLSGRASGRMRRSFPEMVFSLKGDRGIGEAVRTKARQGNFIYIALFTHKAAS